MLAVGLLYMAFIMLRYVPSITIYPLCWEFLSCMNVEFFQKLFLHLLRWSYGFYSSVCYCGVSLIDLWILNHPRIPGINPTWSWCMIPFDHCLSYCWIRFSHTLLRIFASMSSVILACHFLFWCDIFVWFWCQGNAGLIEWVQKCSFLCNFLE